MSTAYIALGSNQGDRHREIIRAITLMTRHELKVYSVSPFIETQPVGFASDFPFINGTVAVHTKSSPQELLTLLKVIESAMGRKKKSHDGIYSDRLIDLDILLYDQVVIDTNELTIPHPRMCERYFVLQPLSYIASELIHPTRGRSVAQLLADLPYGA